MAIPGKFHPKKLYEYVKFWEKKILDSRNTSQVWSQNRKTTILGCRTKFFFLWKKKLIVAFFGVKFTGVYRNIVITPTLFRDHGQNSKKPNFSSFFILLTVTRNNYVMIPRTWQSPVNFTPKNYTSKLNSEKKNFRFPKGSQIRSQSWRTTILRCGSEFFFFVEKKLSLCFLG